MNHLMVSIDDLATLSLAGFERSTVYDSNGEPYTVSFSSERGVRLSFTRDIGDRFIAVIMQEQRPKRYRITGTVAGIAIPPVVAPTAADAGKLVDEYRKRVRKPEDCQLTTEEID